MTEWGPDSENLIQRHTRLLTQLAAMRVGIRNWLTVGAAGYLYKFFPLPSLDINVVTKKGSILSLPLSRNAGALYPVIDGFAFGSYEYTWRLEDEPIVVDIGAHVGSFLIWLAESYPRLRGIAYEPDATAREYLVANLRTNGLKSVEVRSEAVASVAGERLLFVASPGGGASSLFSRDGAPRTSVLTAVVAFDDVVASAHGQISLLKLDCEGAEYDIVLDSNASSWLGIRRIMLEYHPMTGATPNDLLRRLGELGFRCVKGADRIPPAGSFWLER